MPRIPNGFRGLRRLWRRLFRSATKIFLVIAVTAGLGSAAQAQSGLPAVNPAAAGTVAAPSVVVPAASPTPSALPALDGRPVGAPGFRRVPVTQYEIR